MEFRFDVERAGSALPAGLPDETRHFVGIDRVTVCLDRSELGERALPHALSVARALGTPLTLLHVLDAPDGSHAWDAYEWEILRAESLSYLDAVRSRIQKDRGEVAVRVAEGLVEDQLLREIGIGCSQLVVLSTHGEHGLHGWHMGRTARQILAAAPCSLLLVPAWVRPLPLGSGYRRIAVPLDGSPRAECALPVAARLAQECRAELLLVHAVPRIALTTAGAPLPGDEDLARSLEERNATVGSRYLESVRARHADRVAVRALMRRGADVRDVLLALPETEDVDLIVMSAHGRTGSQTRPYGSTTMHAIEHGESPLLLIQDLPPEARVRMAATYRRRQQPGRQMSLYHDELR